MKILKLFVTICALSALTSLNADDIKLIYQNDFNKVKDYADKAPCMFYQNEYHFFSEAENTFCGIKTVPEHALVRFKLISVKTKDEKAHAGLLFFFDSSERSYVLTVYPETKEFMLGYWFVDETSRKKEFVQVVKKQHKYIKKDVNYIDLVLHGGNYDCFINGYKVYNSVFLPKKPDEKPGTRVGLYAVEKSHFHYDDFKVFWVSVNYYNQPQTPDYKAPQKEDDANPYLAAYAEMSGLKTYYGFDEPENSPLVQSETAFNERGTFIITPQTELIVVNQEHVAVSDPIIMEARYKTLSVEANWSGIVLKDAGAPNIYYALLIKPDENKYKIVRKNGADEKILKEGSSNQILKGLINKNILALGKKSKQLFAYINGEKVLELEEESGSLNVSGFGLYASAKNTLEFDYIKFFDVRKSALEKALPYAIGGGALLLVIIVLVIILKSRKKKKSA